MPGDLVAQCDLATAANPGTLTFSPDGSQMAWHDDEGVKVAGVPNLAAGTASCTLTSPAHVISGSGKSPSFGGADVNAVTGAAGGGPAGGGAGSGSGGESGGTKAISVKLSGKATRAAFAKGLTLKVNAAKAGRIDGSASIAARIAKKVGVRGKARAAQISAVGHSAAAATVVARGRATAKGAGVVKPTTAAKRAAKKLRKVTPTIKVSQAGAAGKAKVKLK